jgi:hypothetical protein
MGGVSQEKTWQFQQTFPRSDRLRLTEFAKRRSFPPSQPLPVARFILRERDFPLAERKVCPIGYLQQSAAQTMQQSPQHSAQSMAHAGQKAHPSSQQSTHSAVVQQAAVSQQLPVLAAEAVVAPVGATTSVRLASATNKKTSEK